MAAPGQVLCLAVPSLPRAEVQDVDAGAQPGVIGQVIARVLEGVFDAAEVAFAVAVDALAMLLAWIAAGMWLLGWGLQSGVRMVRGPR